MIQLINNTETTALITERERISYSELEQQSSLLAKYIPPRSLVFALCKNTLGSLVGYVSFITNKSVPVMLDSTMDSVLLEQLIKTYKPNYIWLPSLQCDAGLFQDWKVKVELYDYRLLENPEQTSHKLHPDLALLLTTSGSTGSPKLVRLTYKNIEANARSISEYLEISSHDRPITTLPMHYSYGLSVINSHLMSGATILLTSRSIMENAFWDLFKTEKATSLAGVPYTYQMLKRLRLQRMDLPTLKTLTQAGGKLSAELVSEFAHWAEDSGRRFFVMYGQTEATARMSYLPYDKALEKSASIGVAIPNGVFSIIDTNDNPITEPNTPGELLYRGDNVSMGYAETPADLAEDDENKGLLRTGDVAQFDEDGYYYIVGRLKRFVKIFGNRINLDQTEQIAKQLTQECACTGIDDKLTIHLTDSSLPTEMQQYISQKLGLHPSAISINVVPEIPKNSSGKVQYSLLQ